MNVNNAGDWIGGMEDALAIIRDTHATCGKCAIKEIEAQIANRRKEDIASQIVHWCLDGTTTKCGLVVNEQVTSFADYSTFLVDCPACRVKLDNQ
jgi:hypothetical protein